MQKIDHKLKPGFTLVEVILAIAVLALIMTVLAGALAYGQIGSSASGDASRALKLADEGLNAVRNMRDESFGNVTAGNHGLAIVSNQWAFSGTSDVNGDFTRVVNVVDLTADEKEVTVTVSWNDNGIPKSVQLQTRLNTWPFITPTPTGTFGDWTKPEIQASLDQSGTEDMVEVDEQGNFAYMIRNGGTPNFFVINVTDPDAPVVSGSLTLTNTLVDVEVNGNYAYVVSTSDTAELMVVNISNPASPSLESTTNLAGTNNPNGVHVLGTYVYVARNYDVSNPEMMIINVTNPASPAITSTINSAASVDFEDAFVDGSSLLIGTSSDTQELLVYNISTPASPTLTSSFNLSGTSDAFYLEGFANRIIVGRPDGTINFVNTTNKSALADISSYSYGAFVSAISLNLAQNFVFISGGAASELHIIDYTVEATPVLYGTYNTTATLNGNAYMPTIDRCIGAGTVDNQEIIIFRPYWEGIGNWRTITQEGTYNASGNNDGRNIAVSGDYAYVVRADGTPDFLIINKTNPASPALTGSLNMAGAPYDLRISGSYAYIASGNDTTELQIVNIANPAAPILTGNLDLAGTADATSIRVIGSTAYITKLTSSSPEFYIVNITNPAAPTLIGSLNLTGSFYDVHVSGNYAYLASTDNNTEMQVINITNPAAPVLAATFNAAGTNDGLAITGFGNRVILGQVAGNLTILNVTNPLAPVQVVTYAAGNNINDLTMANNNNFVLIASTNTNPEFQVLNIDNELFPLLHSSYNAPSSLLGVTYDSLLDRAFLTSSDNSRELIIIRPN